MNQCLDAEVLDQLALDGYALLPSIIPDDLLVRLRAAIEHQFELEGEDAGAEFKREPGCRRLANLVGKADVFRECLLFAPVLDAARAVLGDQFKLSSLNVRSVNPNSDVKQPLHADGGAIADQHGFWVFNTIWMLDELTADNGPIRVVPGSHCWASLPADVLPDPLEDHSRQRIVTAPAGSILLLNAHTWHGGLANRTARDRVTLHMFFTRRDKPQQQYQKQLVPREVQQALCPSLRELLALDDLLNDALSSEQSGMSGFLRG